MVAIIGNMNLFLIFRKLGPNSLKAVAAIWKKRVSLIVIPKMQKHASIFKERNSNIGIISAGLTTWNSMSGQGIQMRAEQKTLSIKPFLTKEYFTLFGFYYPVLLFPKVSHQSPGMSALIWTTHPTFHYRWVVYQIRVCNFFYLIKIIIVYRFLVCIYFLLINN